MKTCEAEQQTLVEYVTPGVYHDLKIDMKALDNKLKAQDDRIKELLEDLDLKHRSFEKAVAERNKEREYNLELRIQKETLTIDLHSTMKKAEETGSKLTEVANQNLVLEAEKARLKATIQANDIKLERLTKVFQDLRAKLMAVQKAKTAVEDQLSTAFKKLGLKWKQMKPTDVVNLNRPSSSLKKRGGEDVVLKRNKSREEISVYDEEIKDFMNFDRKRKAKAAANSVQQSSDSRELSERDSEGYSEELDNEEWEERGETAEGRAAKPRLRRKRDYAQASSRQSRSPSGPSTPKRSKAKLKRDEVTFISTLKARSRPKKTEDGTPVPSSLKKLKRSTTIKGDTEASSQPKSGVNFKSPQPRQAVHAKGDRRSQQELEDSSWVHDEDRGAPNEESKAHSRYFSTRSIESVTTNSSDEGLEERTVVNEHGELVAYMDKKQDTRQLNFMIAQECSKAVQFDCDEPEMTFDVDGTATTKDGRARFYLPFNPNVVFGLKGDVFYHSLFQVFQATSKVPDDMTLYLPPYKTDTNKEAPVPPRKPPPMKRSPKKVPHSDSCGVNCKHLMKNVKPKVRDDMVLVLKKQELVI